MEKFKFIAIKRQRKCGAEIGTAMLIGGGLSAVSGLTSGLIGSSSSRSNNAATLAFNREMQQKSMDFEREMYDKQLQDQENLYNKYQSPQAIASQLSKAGLNPSALAGKGLSGSSMPSLPSVGTPATPSLQGLENPAFYLISGIDAATKGISNLSGAILNDKNAQSVSEKLAHEIELLIAQKNGQNLLNDYQSVNNFIQSEFGHDKAGAELQEMHSRIFANYCVGHYNEAEQACKEMLTKIYKQDFDIKEQQRATLMAKLFSEWQLVQEKIKTEQTAQGVNVSISAYNTALAKTENALREGRVELQSLAADLSTLDKYLKGNEVKLSDQTLQARTFGIIEQMYREGLISENIYKEGQILSTKRDWAARQEFANYLNNCVSAGTSVMNSYTNYKGMQLNRLSAKERNDIQRDFVNEYVRQSKSVSNAKRSAVLGPDYEMYSDQFFGR